MGISTFSSGSKLTKVQIDQRLGGAAMVALEYERQGHQGWDCLQTQLTFDEMRMLEDALREYREQAEAQAVVDEMSLQFADLLEPSGVSA